MMKCIASSCMKLTPPCVSIIFAKFSALTHNGRFVCECVSEFGDGILPGLATRSFSCIAMRLLFFCFSSFFVCFSNHSGLFSLLFFPFLFCLRFFFNLLLISASLEAAAVARLGEGCVVRPPLVKP